MLKFFAKYQKLILVFGGSILMVAFLLPNVGGFMPDPGAEAVGHVGDEEVTGNDLVRASGEIDILQRAQGTLTSHVRGSTRQPRLSPLSQMLMNSPLPSDQLQWVLLQHDALKHGVYVSRGEGAAMLREMVEAGVDVSPLVNRAGEDAIADALAHWQTLVYYDRLIAGMGVPSEPRLRHLARDVQSKATVKFVAIDPAKAVKDLPEPTEPQLVEQFEAFKDKKAGTEGATYSYILQPRVKLEYIAVPLERVKLSVEVDEVDAIEYYQSHPREFYPEPEKPKDEKDPFQFDLNNLKLDTGLEPLIKPEAPAEEPKPEAPACEEEPAAEVKPEVEAETKAEAPAPPPNQPLPYAQVRQRIIDKLVDERARQKQTRILKFIQEKLAADTGKLPIDKEGYRTLPIVHQATDLEALAKLVQGEFGVLPDVVKLDRWLTQKDLSDLEGFGDASVETASFPLPVSFYVQTARELKVEGFEQLSSLKLQAGVPSRIAQDRQGVAYIFRITEAQPEQTPKGLDDVREQVVKDVKEKSAYESLKTRADELVELARKEGLDAVAKQFEAEVKDAEGFTPYESPGTPPVLPEVGRSEPFVRAVFTLAREIAEVGGLDEVDPAKAFTTVAADDARRLCVVKLEKYEPVDSAMYELLRPGLSRFAFSAEQAQIKQERMPLAKEALIERTGFKYVRGQEEEAEGDEPAKQEADTASY